jgi:hypothetical protein
LLVTTLTVNRRRMAPEAESCGILSTPGKERLRTPKRSADFAAIAVNVRQGLMLRR